LYGVVPPAAPGEEGVEGREQDAEAGALAEREEVVPEPHHRGDGPADGALEVAVLALAVLEHEPEAGDAVRREVHEVPLDGGRGPCGRKRGASSGQVIASFCAIGVQGAPSSVTK
jgi:hypothetical protein